MASACPIDGTAVPVPVLVIGPPGTETGGMVTVIGLMDRVVPERRFHLNHFATTSRMGHRLNAVTRFLRHATHLGRLVGAIRTTGAVLVHLHTCSGFTWYRMLVDLVAARICGCQVILHVHGASFDRFHAESGLTGRWLIGWGLRTADRVIALSHGWANQLRRMAPGARIVVVENAVELPDLGSESLPPGADGRSQPVRFLFLGRMDTWKGVEDLLEAAEILVTQGVSFELRLAGPGGSAADEESIVTKIRDRRLTPFVEYVGTLTAAQRRDRLLGTDALVLPSHHEGLPMAVLEAYAHGVPVIATAVGAVPEILIDGVHGRLVSVRDPGSLAACMAELAREPTLRRTMGRAARRLAEQRFAAGRFASDLRRLYQDLLVKPR